MRVTAQHGSWRAPAAAWGAALFTRPPACDADWFIYVTEGVGLLLSMWYTLVCYKYSKDQVCGQAAGACCLLAGIRMRCICVAVVDVRTVCTLMGGTLPRISTPWHPSRSRRKTCWLASY